MTRSKPKHSGQIRAESEWYVEPSWVVEALEQREDLSRYIYDPACGCGVIPSALKARGYQTYATDLIDRGYIDMIETRDFLNDPSINSHCTIVCNPPYLRGEGTIAFINRALEANYQKACFIVNESFLFSRRRKKLFETWPLESIWFLSDRPSMPPGHLLSAGKIEAKGGTANYAWLVFKSGYLGKPICGWLGKDDAKFHKLFLTKRKLDNAH